MWQYDLTRMPWQRHVLFAECINSFARATQTTLVAASSSSQ